MSQDYRDDSDIDDEYMDDEFVEESHRQSPEQKRSLAVNQQTPTIQAAQVPPGALSPAVKGEQVPHRLIGNLEYGIKSSSPAHSKSRGTPSMNPMRASQHNKSQKANEDLQDVAVKTNKASLPPKQQRAVSNSMNFESRSSGGGQSSSYVQNPNRKSQDQHSKSGQERDLLMSPPQFGSGHTRNEANKTQERVHTNTLPSVSNHGSSMNNKRPSLKNQSSKGALESKLSARKSTLLPIDLTGK